MKKYLFSIISILASLIVMPACKDDNTVAMPEKIVIKLNETNIEIEAGNTVSLKATLTNGKEETILWQTSNAKIATVSNGLVKGINQGEAIITAMTSTGYKTNCKVTVKANSSTNQPNNEEKTDNKSRLLGADISMLPQYQEFGTKYKDIDGKEVDLLPFLDEQGMNAMRVRLFVKPTKEKEVVQDVEYVISLAKQIKSNGFKFMLDFHYSDTWADPSKQTKPSEWNSLSDDELTTKIYDYTKETLQKFVSNEVCPDYIQIGNEISYGMLWENGKVSYMSSKNWDKFCTLLNNASKACRETTPEAKVIIHIERSNESEKCLQFLSYMDKNKVDYDIFGLSYYPIWHGKTSDFENTLYNIENTTEKEIMIVEFAYNYNWYPKDAIYPASEIGYEGTPVGQKQITSALIEMLNTHTRVTGLFWWFPEENECPFTDLLNGWKNRGLFDNETGKALPALYELKKFVK